MPRRRPKAAAWRHSRHPSPRRQLLLESRSLEEGRIISLGGVRLNLAELCVERGARRPRLTVSEAALIAYLVDHAERLVPYEELISVLHGGISFARGQLRVRVTACSVRNKLGPAQRCLETVHGMGYLLTLKAR